MRVSPSSTRLIPLQFGRTGPGTSLQCPFGPGLDEVGVRADLRTPELRVKGQFAHPTPPFSGGAEEVQEFQLSPVSPGSPSWGVQSLDAEVRNSLSNTLRV